MDTDTERPANPEVSRNMPLWNKTFAVEYFDGDGDGLEVHEYRRSEPGDAVHIRINGYHGSFDITREQARSLAERLLRFADGGRVVTPEEMKDA